MRRRRFAVLIIWLAALLGTSANSMAQGEPNDGRWGEKFNTTGVRLVLKEIDRSRVNGRTVVTYNLFASGLPRDTPYVLWTRLIGSAPQPAAEAFLNDEGKAVSQPADSKRQFAEDPLNLKVFAGKGEPKRFALISKDGRFRAFAEAIPFPMEVSDGPCHLSVVMTGENYSSVIIHLAGFHGGEDLGITTQSDGEQGQSKAKTTALGTYDSALFPAVKGKHSGVARFKVSAKSCSVTVEFPWGDGSYELQ